MDYRQYIRPETILHTADTPVGPMQFRPVAHGEVLVQVGPTNLAYVKEDVVTGTLFIVRGATGWEVGYRASASHLHRYHVAASPAFRPCSPGQFNTVAAAAIALVEAWAPGQEAAFRAAHLERLALRLSVAEHDLELAEAAVQGPRTRFEAARDAMPTETGGTRSSAALARAQHAWHMLATQIHEAVAA